MVAGQVNNLDVGRKLRGVADLQAVPSQIAGEIVPVVVVNPENYPVEVQQAGLETFTVQEATADTQYTQVATADVNNRLFFLGVQGWLRTTGEVYIEDADSGNIAFSDGGSVGLADFQPSIVASQTNVNLMLPQGRECTRGIRVAVVNSAATSQRLIFYFYRIPVKP